jgi:formylmethanofuran dehydrogenase subunit D
MEMNKGKHLETGKSRTDAIDALIKVLLEEGYTIDKINEEDGSMTTKTRFIPMGVAYYKIGDPITKSKNDGMYKVNVSATVTKTGGLKIKTEAIYYMVCRDLIEKAASGKQGDAKEQVAARCSNELSEYYLKKVKKRLEHDLYQTRPHR